MKINFTRREYQVLMELVHLGNWLLYAHDETQDTGDAPHNVLVQRIYSHAKEMGCEHLVMNSAGVWYESREFEDAMQAHIQDYDAETLWDELASRLALRDAEKSVGREVLAELEPEERIRLILEHEERWLKEFSEHGIGRLVISAVVGN